MKTFEYLLVRAQAQCIQAVQGSDGTICLGCAREAFEDWKKAQRLSGGIITPNNTPTIKDCHVD